MINSDYQCKLCNHQAGRHFKSVVENPDMICLDCVIDPRYDNTWHEFEPDNLKYLELRERDNV